MGTEEGLKALTIITGGETPWTVEVRIPVERKMVSSTDDSIFWLHVLLALIRLILK
jgi:hypothetical protein